MTNLTEEKEIQLSPDELSVIAGYESESEQEALVEPPYSWLESESGEVREVHEKGGVRLGVVGGLVALFLGCGWGLMQILSPQHQNREPLKVEATTTPEEDQEEVEQLKAELALQGQSSQTQEKSGIITIRESSELPPAPKPMKRVKINSHPPRHSTTSLPSRSEVYIPRPVTPLSVPYRPVKVQPTLNRDPYKQWEQLALRGYTSVGNADIGELATKSTLKPQTQSEPESEPEENWLASKPKKESNSLRGTIGQTPQQNSGEEGILNRTTVVEESSSSRTSKEVAIGTSVRGIITVPLIWSPEESQSSTDGRFVVELTEPLMAVDGTVALSAGTVVVVQADSLSPEGMVSSEARAIISQVNGSSYEIPISSGAIVILSEGNSPLLAEGNFDPGGDIAKQDILMGTLGALAKVGEIINQPDEEVMVTDEGRVIARTTNGEPNLTAAALEGFFKPISKAVGQRSSATVKEMLRQKNIAVLPQGKEVSVLVKSFLTVPQ